MQLPEVNELFHDIKRAGCNHAHCHGAMGSLNRAVWDMVQRDQERIYTGESNRPLLFEQEFLDWVKNHDEIGEYPGIVTFYRTYRREFTKEEYKEELRKDRERAEERRRAAEASKQRAIELAEKKAMAAIDAAEQARLEAFDSMADDAERILHNSYYTNQERIMRGEMDIHDQLVETVLRDDAAQKIRREMDEKRLEAINAVRNEMQDIQSDVHDEPSGRYTYDKEKKCYVRYIKNSMSIPYYGLDFFRALKIAPELMRLTSAKKQQEEAQKSRDNWADTESHIKCNVYSTRLPWRLTLFLLLLSGVLLFFLMKIGLMEWLPLYLEDPERSYWFNVPKVSLLFLHLQAHTALKIVIAASLLMLLAAGSAARRRLIHYPLSVMMGILLASLAFFGPGTCVIMSIAVIVVLFTLTISEYGRSEADERTGHGFFDLFLVIASVIVFAVKRNFFLEKLSRLNLLILIFLAVLTALAVYTVIMIFTVAGPARQDAEEYSARYLQEAENELSKANEYVQKLEKDIEALIKDEQQVLLEYKTLWLLYFWLNCVCRNVLTYKQIWERDNLVEKANKYREMATALKQAVK